VRHKLLKNQSRETMNASHTFLSIKYGIRVMNVQEKIFQKKTENLIG